jgi:hypothetical protein
MMNKLQYLIKLHCVVLFYLPVAAPANAEEIPNPVVSPVGKALA